MVAPLVLDKDCCDHRQVRSITPISSSHDSLEPYKCSGITLIQRDKEMEVKSDLYLHHELIKTRHGRTRVSRQLTS
jgi:hypothetical protein